MALIDTIELYKVLAAFAYSILEQGWGLAVPAEDFQPGAPVQGSGVTRRIIDDHRARGIFDALVRYVEVDAPDDLSLDHFAIDAQLDEILYPPQLHLHLREESFDERE